MNNFSFSIDDDTRIILDTTVWCLENFFGYPNHSAIRAVNNYYIKNKNRFDSIDYGDNFYHYEGSYRMALRINYSEVLELGIDIGEEFIDWIRNNENINILREVHIYLIKFYRRKE